MELRLASGHFSVAGAELADKVVAVKKTNKEKKFLKSMEPAWQRSSLVTGGVGGATDFIISRR